MAGKKMNAQEAYNALREYEKNKDYAAMAQIVCDSFVLEGDDLTIDSEKSMSAGYIRYFQELGKRNNGVPTEENKDIVKGVLTEIQRIRVNSIIDASRKIEKWENDIVEGKVEELVGLKNDKKFAHKVAHDIVMQKDPQGVYVRGGVSALGSVLSEITKGSDQWRGLLATDYKKGETEFKKLTDRTKSELITQLIKENGTIDAEKAQKAINEYESGAPKAKEYGFDITRGIGFGNGEKLCEKMPKKYAMVESLKNADEYEKLISKYENDIVYSERIENVAKSISRESKSLVWELDDDIYGNKISENEKFMRMQDIVENLSNIGTRYMIPMGKKKLPTKDVSPKHISNDIKELRKLAREIMPDIDNLSEKEMEAANKAVNKIKTFADKYSKQFKQVTTGKEMGTTQGAVKSSLETIDFIESQGKNRNIDLSEGRKKREESNRMRRSANAIDDALAEAEAAKKGVYRGSKRYDDAVESLYKLSDAYNTYRDMYNDPEISEEEKTEIINTLKEAGSTTKKAIGRYFERKQQQGMLDGKADAKTQKRIDALVSANKLTESILENAEKVFNELNAGEDAEFTGRVSGVPEDAKEAEPEADEADDIHEAIDSMVMDRETKHSKNSYESMVNDAAANAAHLLADYALSDPRTYTPMEQLEIRKAMLALACQDYFTNTEKGSKVFEKMCNDDMQPAEYDRFVLNKMASSKNFAKATSIITHSDIIDFMTDKKAPLKLMEKYSVQKVINAEPVVNERTSAVGRNPERLSIK